jgi:LuxR family maltose regulon positive regulatory protein
MADQNSVIARKLRPPQELPHAVRRQALLDFLHAHVQKKALTISAPAGSGKTSLLADFLAEVDTAVCWYTLDAGDVDPHVLVEGLVAAVQARFPDVGRQALSSLALASGQAGLTSGPLNALTREMASLIPGFFLFVIEDLHNAEPNPDSSAIIDRLIECSPESCHFILTSRNPVRLPALAKLEMRQQAGALDADRLLLTKEETRSLLSARLGKLVSAAEADRVFAETMGWIPAVLLHGLNLDPKAPAGGLPRNELFDYLAAEVFLAQPPEVQQFLLATSVLDELVPEFCDLLLDIRTSAALLEDMWRKGLFTSLAQAEPRTYVYHPLLKGFLTHRLSTSEPERFLILHFKAGRLLEREKRWPRAFDHFLAARRYADAARIVLAVGDEHIRAGRFTTVARWIDLLPRSVVTDQAGLSVLKAGAMVHLGDSVEAARLLTTVLADIPPDDWLLTARALCWRCAAFRMMSRFSQAKKDVHEALHLLTGHGGPPDVTGDAYRQLGDIYTTQGQFRAALKYELAALKHYDSLCDLALTSTIHNSLGIIYRRLGQLGKACFHLERAREGWQKLENPSSLAATLNNLGITYQRRGEYGFALQTLRLALDKAREAGHKRTQAGVMLSMAEALRDGGLLRESLADFQRGLEIAREIVEPYFVTYALIGMGEVQRLLGNLETAEALEKDAVIQCEANKQEYERTLARVQLGVIARERGNFALAAETLEDCCQRLASAGDQPALANAHFQVANTAFLARRYGAIRAPAEKVAAIARELGFDGFLLAEYRNAVLLLQYCITEGICPDFFRKGLASAKRAAAEASEYGDTPGRAGQPAVVESQIVVASLGAVEVKIGERVVRDDEWRTKKARELFLYLVACDGPRNREQITAAIWPELDESKGASNFHINLHRARQATIPVLLLTRDGKYFCNPDIPISFDVREFRALLRRANEPIHEDKRIELLERATSLYRGPFAEDIYEDWAEEMRRSLLLEHVRALFALAECYQRRRRHAEAAKLMERVINCDPYNDHAYRNLLEWQIAAGDRGSAHQTYRRYRDAVVRELHSSSPRIEELFHRIVG